MSRDRDQGREQGRDPRRAPREGDRKDARRSRPGQDGKAAPARRPRRTPPSGGSQPGTNASGAPSSRQAPSSRTPAPSSRQPAPSSRTAPSRTPAPPPAGARPGGTRSTSRGPSNGRVVARPAASVRGRRKRTPKRSRANLTRRGRWATIVMITLLLIAGVRLALVQTVDAAAWAAKGEDQRTREITLHAQRGQITDRNGTVLAFTVEGRALAARPTKFRTDAQRQQVAQIVLGVIKGTEVAQGVTEQSLMKKLTSTRTYVYLVRGLSPAQGDRILKLVRPVLIPESLNLSNDEATEALNAVVTERQDLRRYPSEGVADPIIGRGGWDGHGLSGIENRFDARLAGKDGSREVEVDPAGRIVPGSGRDEVPAVNGSDVQLSLDTDLQYTAQQLLADAVTRQCAKGGDLIIMGAKDAQIFAMASYVPGKTGAELGNRALLAPFEPGSVNKVITMAAALEKKIITPTTVLTVDGQITMGSATVHDAWAHDTVQMTATGVLAKSSNVGTLMIAQKLGEKAYYSEMLKFGLGQKTGIELFEDRGEMRKWDADTAKSQWDSATFANLPIGQGVSVTLLQLASMYQAIANGGVKLTPSILAPSSSTTAKPAGTRVMQAKTATTLLSMLGAVIQFDGENSMENGTGYKAAINGYLVAGKTGTAQQVDEATQDYSDTLYNSTFAGIVPADNPKYVIALRLDAPCASSPEGTSAAPLFHRIASYAMDEANVPPSTKQAKKYQLYVNLGG